MLQRLTLFSVFLIVPGGAVRTLAVRQIKVRIFLCGSNLIMLESVRNLGQDSRSRSPPPTWNHFAVWNLTFQSPAIASDYLVVASSHVLLELQNQITQLLQCSIECIGPDLFACTLRHPAK
jgi:hypothetical protein